MSPLAFLQRPLRWLQAISRTRTTISGGPNFAYDLCARSVTDEQFATLDLSSWEVAFVGAEPVRSDVLARFAEVFAPCGFRKEALYPCYGLAEATLVVAGGRRHEPPIVRNFDQSALEAGTVVGTSDQEAARRLVGCGHAPESQDVRIVDPATCIPSPHDCVGEIWVRGASVVRGYWNQPIATEATFGAYLGETAEGPFLRTGDLGFLSDGELFVAGRIKDLIIIRGRNLYPQDIEATVEASHPALRANGGAAFAIDHGEEELLLVVQEVERTHRKTDLGQVCETIRQAVADEYEVGVYGVVLVRPGSIPKTSSGKIQRYRCRQDFLEDRLQILEQSILEPGSSLRSSRPYVPPRTELEGKLIRLWQDMLGVERIGIDDNFFALGGDSLLALQVVSRAREAGIQLTVERLLEHPTIAGVAADMEGASVIDAEQGLVSGPVPITPRQHLFFESGARHQRGERTLLEVLQPLDPALLRRAVEGLLRHHDGLRTRFTCTQGGWRAHIETQEEHEVFSHRDIGGLSDEEQRSAIEHAMKMTRKEIDTSEGPLIRMVLFDRGYDKRQVLLFAIHHLVADGLSVAVLGEDLQLAYEQLHRGDELQLPAKTTSVRTWAERLVRYANSLEARRELEYWRTAIPAALPSLPLDYPDGIDREGRMRRVLVTLDPSATVALLNMAVTTFETQIDRVVLGAVASAFTRWTGHPFLHVEYTGHGREPLFHDFDLSRTVGWFTSRFPVFIPAEPSARLGELVGSVARQLREIPHGGIGYGILRYLSDEPAVVEALERLPRAEIGFNYQGHLDRLYGRSSLFKADQRLPESTSNRLLASTTWIQIMSNIASGRLHVRFEYHESIYASGTIEQLACDTLDALNRMIAEKAYQHGWSGAPPVPALDPTKKDEGGWN
jgi:non-ribosomal peptide synthase protein (TIGR01720 family)